MFKDKVVIITGASSGIGKALAFEFARNGSHVVLAARSMQKLNEIAAECENFGGKALALSTDVSIKSDCEQLILKTIQKFGKIDILVNNAGISMRALFTDVDISVLEKLMDTNYWGTVHCTKYALPYLLQSKGTVIGVISVASFRGLPARIGYSASKYAMYGFLETLRTENLKTGINVLTVSPGFTSSNIRNSALNKKGRPQKESPLNEKKLMSSETVAKKVIKALRKGKKLVILTLAGKSIFWLGRFLPIRYVDKQIYRNFAHEPDSPLK